MTTQKISKKVYTYESSELVIKNTTYKFLLTKVNGNIHSVQIKRVQSNNKMNPMNVFWSIDEATSKYKNPEIKLHLLKLELGF